MNVEPLYDERTSTLTYVVYDPSTLDAVAIDPVLDFDPAGGVVWRESVERVASLLEAKKLRLRWVLETHAHADHLSGSQWLKEKFGALIGVHERIRLVQSTFREVFDLQDTLPVDGSQFDRLLRDDEIFEAGSLRFRVIPTPGHTPACSSFFIEDAVFTGDTLCLDDNGVGRCDFPGGDAGQLYDSVTQRLWTLPPHTRVFPGHDYPPETRGWKASTTIASSRQKNAQLREGMSREEFVEMRTARDRTLAPPKLLYPSIQVNIDAGRLPPMVRGKRFLKIPLQER